MIQSLLFKFSFWWLTMWLVLYYLLYIPYLNRSSHKSYEVMIIFPLQMKKWVTQKWGDLPKIIKLVNALLLSNSFTFPCMFIRDRWNCCLVWNRVARGSWCNFIPKQFDVVILHKYTILLAFWNFRTCLWLPSLQIWGLLVIVIVDKKGDIH